MAAEEEPLLLAPNEILEQYLIRLDPEFMDDACKSFKEFNNICKDDRFWRLKLEYEYETLPEKRGSWKKTWVYLNRPRLAFTWKYLPVIYDDIEEVWEDVDFINITSKEINRIKQYIKEITGRFIPSYISLDEVIIDNNKITFIYTLPMPRDPNEQIFPKVIENDLHQSILDSSGIAAVIPVAEHDYYNYYESEGVELTGDADVTISRGSFVKKLTDKEKSQEYYSNFV